MIRLRVAIYVMWTLYWAMWGLAILCFHYRAFAVSMLALSAGPRITVHMLNQDLRHERYVNGIVDEVMAYREKRRV